jgi:hypothetical protein
MTKAEARREILVARELARVRGAEKSIDEIIREVRGSERPLAAPEPVDADLKKRLASARSLRPIPLPEPEPAAPKVAYYWEQGARWSALRRVVIAQPPKPPRVDSWGRPKWA